MLVGQLTQINQISLLPCIHLYINAKRHPLHSAKQSNACQICDSTLQDDHFDTFCKLSTLYRLYSQGDLKVRSLLRIQIPYDNFLQTHSNCDAHVRFESILSQSNFVKWTSVMTLPAKWIFNFIFHLAPLSLRSQLAETLFNPLVEWTYSWHSIIHFINIFYLQHLSLKDQNILQYCRLLLCKMW